MKYVDEKEEMRDDYLVTTETKKIWNIQMEMLDKLDKICKKHNIKYFADSGTLIGAVRDGGYIPWDDDIDISMKREDYDKFIEIAKKELKEPLFIQTALTDTDYFRMHAQIRNSNTTAILKTELEDKYEFNQGIFIDIFPLDEVTNNKFLFKIQMLRLKILKFIILFGHQKNRFEKDKLLKNILLATLVVPAICKLIVKILGKNRIIKRFYKVSAKYNGKNNKEIGNFSLSFGQPKNIWDINCFVDTKRIKFEKMMINIPIGYDSRLRKEYGDYMKKVKAPTTHGSIIFDSNKSYKDYIK